MDFIFISLSLLLVISGVLRQGMASLGVISGVIYLATSLLFILYYYEIVYLEDYKGLPIEYGISFTDYYRVLLLLFPFLFVNLVITYYSPVRLKTLSFNSGRLIKIGARSLVGLSGFILLAFLFCIFHALDIDWSLVKSNTAYLLLVSPVSSGVDYGVVSIFHNSMGVLGLMCSCVLVVLFYEFLRTRSGLLLALFVIAFCVWGYLFFFKLIQFSRWSSLMVFGLLIPIAVIMKRRLALLCFLVLILTAGFLILVLCIYGRSGYTHGFDGLVFTLQAISWTDLSEVSLSLYANVFGGAFSIARSTDSVVSYPLAYKLLSFSFLPGFVDGWSSLVNYQHRINVFAPFSAVAEVFQFGLGFYAAYVGGYWIVSSYVNRLVYRLSAIPSALLLLVYAYTILSSLFYPVRNTVKFLVVVIIVFFIFEYVSSKLNRKLGKL